MIAPRFDSPSSATDRTLFDLLASAARRTPRARLADCFIVGTHGALAIGVFATPWWLLAMPLACVAAFGAWGLAARAADELEAAHLEAAHADAPVRRIAWRAAEAAAVLVGVTAALVVIFAIFLVLSGPAPIS